MPNFEQDLKMRWFSVLIPVFLIPLILFAAPNEPIAFVALLGAIVGGLMIIASKIAHKIKSKKLSEWGDTGVDDKYRSIYSFGYVLVFFSAVYTIYEIFS